MCRWDKKLKSRVKGEQAKFFYIVIPEGWSGLLEFTRVDLYKFAGMMSKGVKAGKRPKQIN